MQPKIVILAFENAIGDETLVKAAPNRRIISVSIIGSSSFCGWSHAVQPLSVCGIILSQSQAFWLVKANKVVFKPPLQRPTRQSRYQQKKKGQRAACLA
jgi:hypothetical protein